MRALIGIGLTLIILVSIGTILYMGPSPRGPLHHISQQVASTFCSDGIAGPQQNSIEGATDGQDDVHSYYTCPNDGTTIPAYQH